MWTALMPTYTLKLDYFAYFHFIMSYESILWEKSTAKETFTIQKKIANLDESQVQRTVSCRELPTAEI